MKNHLQVHVIEAFYILLSLKLYSFAEDEQYTNILECLDSYTNSPLLRVLKDYVFNEKQRRKEMMVYMQELWQLKKPEDFEPNVFEAATKGKLTSIIYLLATGTNINKRY